ncbi:MAG: hypothetical protein ACKVUS_21285 [Saprospiraceae bacterium]
MVNAKCLPVGRQGFEKLTSLKHDSQSNQSDSIFKNRIFDYSRTLKFPKSPQNIRTEAEHGFLKLDFLLPQQMLLTADSQEHKAQRETLLATCSLKLATAFFCRPLSVCKTVWETPRGNQTFARQTNHLL